MYTFLTLAEDQSKVKIEATRETPYEQRVAEERRVAEIARTKARQAQQAKSNRALRGKGAKASGSNANDNSNRVANVSNDRHNSNDIQRARRTIRVEATAYTAGPESTGKSPGDPSYGITASGETVREGVTLACPPSVPFGTKVEIEGIGTRVCQDRGAHIQEGRVDIFMRNLDDARNFGRKTLEIHVEDESRW